VRVGVIGSNGFVGAALLRALIGRAEPVQLKLPEFNLCDPATWSGISGLDCVVHTAARQYTSRFEIYDVNARSAGALARECNKAGVKKFVYLSTGAIYGPRDMATTPEMEPRPADDYAVSKWLAEKKFNQLLQAQLHILRIYFPYGGGQKVPRLIPRLVDAVRFGKEIRCNPDGGPFLSIGHVEDIAEKISADFVLGADERRVVNVASDQVISIEKIARSIATRLGVEARFVRDGNASNSVSVPFRPGTWRPFRADELV